MNYFGAHSGTYSLVPNARNEVWVVLGVYSLYCSILALFPLFWLFIWFCIHIVIYSSMVIGTSEMYTN